MKINAITIEREYGSGGTEAARRLSEETGIPCYGSEILEEVSKEYGISVDTIEKYEEKATGSFLYSLYAMAKAASGDSDMLTQEGHVYLAEQKVIRRLAMNGPAIFLGHCASEALKEKKKVIRVFIRCSDEEQKKKRIETEYGIPAAEVAGTAKRFDKKRANYYYANTGRKWDCCSNYDMMLDSGTLGAEGCAAALQGLLRH